MKDFIEQPNAEMILKYEENSWKIAEYSEGFLRLINFSHEQMKSWIGQPFIDLFSSTDICAVNEFLLAKPSRQFFPWIFTLSLDRQQEATPVFMQRDFAFEEPTIRVMITDGSFVEQKFGQLEKRLSLIEQGIYARLCQFVLNEDLTVIWHNEYFLKDLGYTQQQFDRIGRKISAYIEPSTLPAFIAEIKAGLENGLSQLESEVTLIHADGSQRNFMTHIFYTSDELDGDPVIYSFSLDITAQKQSQTLEQNAQALRDAFEQGNCGIWDYNRVTRCLTGSKEIERYFGLSGDVCNPEKKLLESHVVQEKYISVLEGFFERIHNGCTDTMATIAILAGEEDLVWLKLHWTAIPSHEELPKKGIIIVEDVTKQVQLEMQYREEENRRIAMTADMEFYCQIDLTTGQLLSFHKDNLRGLQPAFGDDAGGLLDHIGSHFVEAEDRVSYQENFNIQEMIKRFEQGIPEKKFDFRINHPALRKWYRGIAYIIREPRKGHLYAYLYTQDIDGEKALEIKLRHHAEQDALTGLYNRYTTELHCEEALKRLSDGRLAMMYLLDVGNFKKINESFGHIKGDLLLQDVGKLIREIFGQVAIVGRVGSDEFLILDVGISSIEKGIQKAGEICRKGAMLESGEGIAGLTVGISSYPQHGLSFGGLYRCADEALFRAKQKGESHWIYYQDKIHEPISEPSSQEASLVSRDWLLEESNDIIYVSDFYNYDLLYMNKGARKIFGIGDGAYLGHKCYEILQQQDRPCEFCSNHLLTPDNFYSWEFRNPIAGRTFLLRDRIVDWYGKPARIELATDVSAIDHRAQTLADQLKIDQMIIACLRIINDHKNFKYAADALLEKLTSFYHADRAFIVDYDQEKNILRSRYESPCKGLRPIAEVLNGEGVPPSQLILDSFQNRTHYFYEQINTGYPQTEQLTKVLYDVGIDHQLAVPFYLDGQPMGIIGVDNPTVYCGDTTVLETLSYFVAEEMARNRLSDTLTYLSYHDSLTGLWNRNHYVEQMYEQQNQQFSSLGVAVADINALSTINRIRGHSEGDLVVKRAADLLREAFPQGEIFRLSGDEFVIHNKNIDRLSFLDQVTYVGENGHRLKGYGISVGYAWTDREIEYSRLTTQATDVMMLEKRLYHESKRLVGDGLKYDQQRLEGLLDSLSSGKFKVYLQPKACCSTFSLNGAEALVRYQDEHRGIVSPGLFIPVLEEDHMIQYLDFFVFEEVCRMLSRWKEENRTSLVISLNFSRQTVLEPNLLKRMIDVTDQYDVDRNMIEIEITETLGEYEYSTIAEFGEGVKSAGFRLAMDDFGSRYANMTMLSAVPVHVLKLDRDLIQNVLDNKQNQLILKSILSLCQDLEISSIAEGVETKEQLDLLRGLNCDSIQGYYFGRPMPISEFENKFL